MVRTDLNTVATLALLAALKGQKSHAKVTLARLDTAQTVALLKALELLCDSLIELDPEASKPHA